MGNLEGSACHFQGIDRRSHLLYSLDKHLKNVVIASRDVNSFTLFHRLVDTLPLRKSHPLELLR